MKLILKKRIENLGDAGTVVSVKPGYARNYLLPQGLAYEASPGNLLRIEEEQKLVAERARRDYLEARRRGAQLDGVVLTFQERASEEGRLFGSVTAADVAEQLNTGNLDFEVERRQVVLDEPIKELGIHPVEVRLHAEVVHSIEVRIEREGD
jgi:large subunit ribosomal protein L9